MSARSYFPRRASGVTMIELLIVVVIVGILAAVAYPMYRENVRAGRRADGMAALHTTQQLLERCYTRYGAYNNAGCATGLPFTTAKGFYTISAVGSITANAYTLAATPAGAQNPDTRCGVLRLYSTGVQGSQGAATDTNKCWKN